MEEAQPIVELGGYTAQSSLIKLHPQFPIIARSLDFDIEIKDLTGQQSPFLLRFPLSATSWIIQDFIMSGTTLYAAVTV